MHESVAGSAPQSQCRTVDPMKAKAKCRLRLEHELSGLSNKALAIGLNTSEAQLTRYLGEQYPDDLPSYKIPAVVRELGPGYMEWMAIQCGGVYHHGAQATRTNATTTTLIGLLAKQGGAVIQQLLQHLEDHIWSEAERRKDVAGLRKMKTLLESLLTEAEGGAK